MNVALVHDWLNQMGGAEDVLEVFGGLFPQAPVYTSLYWREKMPAHYQSWDIRCNFINQLPFAQRHQQLYFPLYPLAFEQFDFQGYDLVISNKSGFCHGILTGSETVHICYCLTPTRYVWRYAQYAEQEGLHPLIRWLLQPFLYRLRQWDRLAADRVDHFVAISTEIQRRIAKIYRRQSVIIYPPVDTNRFAPANQTEDYFLFVGRLVPYRRLDLLVEAFNQLGLPLVIAGTGRDLARLQNMAKSNITFLGYVSDYDLPALLARCNAFVFPGEEDFGIAPIQAMASGRPVIAYAAGGSLDTVIPGETGLLFSEQTVAALIQAVQQYDPTIFSPTKIRQWAERFDVALFRQQILTYVEQVWAGRHVQTN